MSLLDDWKFWALCHATAAWLGMNIPYWWWSR